MCSRMLAASYPHIVLPLADTGGPSKASDGKRWRAQVDVHVGNARSLHFEEEEARCYLRGQP